jgi:hypothetical protein
VTSLTLQKWICYLQGYVSATGYGLNDLMIGVRFQAGAGNFLFDTVSRTALEPTSPLTQRVLAALCLGVKRPGRKVDHLSPSTAEVKECVELYIHYLNKSSWRGA